MKALIESLLKMMIHSELSMNCLGFIVARTLDGDT